MRKLVITAVAAMALTAPAMADSIIVTAVVDGVLADTFTSANGTLNVTNQSFTDFTLNTITVNDQNFLAPPGELRTNTLNVDQIAGGTHKLVLDIRAIGLTGLTGLQNFLSSFSVTNQGNGWTSDEQTFINGGLLADTGLFSQTSGSAFSTNAALAANPFTAEARYTINTVGTGQFAGGIAIDLAAVPGPTMGAGVPGLLAGLGLLGFMMRRKPESLEA